MVIKTYIVEREGEARLADHPHLKAELVARMHVNGGRPMADVMEHYGLTRAEVHAALAYYYENREALDDDYERSWSESRAIKAEDLRKEIEARRRRTS